MFLYIIPVQSYKIVKERIEMHAIVVILFKIISFFFYDFIPWHSFCYEQIVIPCHR